MIIASHSLSLTLFSRLYFAGRFFASAAYDCFASQTACNNIGTFIDKLPQDSIVLIAIQESGATSSHRPPSSKLLKLGAQNIASVAENTAYVLIGYKGSKSVDWKQELFKTSAAGPAEVSGLIPIQCSDLPSGKVQFNCFKKNIHVSGKQLPAHRGVLSMTQYEVLLAVFIHTR